jgi:hypothetical protein
MELHASLRRTFPDPLLRRVQAIGRVLSSAAAHPGYALSRMPFAGEVIAALAPPKRPPILLISLPRAGSSWIGRILGSSEGALYLREPLNQSYLDRHGSKVETALFEFGMCLDKPTYERCADLTFRGIPRFNRSIVQYPEQWRLAERRRRQVVVKEVNPLTIDMLWERHRPRIVFLVRHPVPVVRSSGVLGWTSDRFRTGFLPETVAQLRQEYVIPATTEPWEQGGAFHAIVQNRVMALLSGTDHTVVRFEDVCADPLAEFTRLFDFCGLPLSPALRREIVRSSQSEADYAPGRYDTVRNSDDIKDRWKREVDPDDIGRLRHSYFANRPIFYTDEADW